MKWEPWPHFRAFPDCSAYQVSVVVGAGALLSDTHTEAGQATIFVLLAKMEGSGLAPGARRVFNIHL